MRLVTTLALGLTALIASCADNPSTAPDSLIVPTDGVPR
jgi:hypothetical protein